MRSPTAAAILVGVGLTGLLPLACTRPGNTYVAPPPPEVTVIQPMLQTVEDTLETTGTTHGVEQVELRARVRGFIEKRLLEGGARVKTGDLVYVIDPRPFEAVVRESQAQVESAKANLRIADVTVERLQRASQADAVSKTELDEAVAQRDAAAAQVSLAEARLSQAALDLEFTEVRAPISGRLGSDVLDVGQLVGAAEPTLLGVIINDSKLHARYTLSEMQVLTLRCENQGSRPGENGRPSLIVRLGMANETGYPHQGTFFKADNTVDPTTGTIAVEAVFDNPHGHILPGLFVRIQCVLGERSAMLIPDVAIQSDQLGRFVLVVNDKDVVERRNVRAGPTYHNHLRRIDEGLEANARVVVNGLQRARPGVSVKAIQQADPDVPSTIPPPSSRPSPANSDPS